MSLDATLSQLNVSSDHDETLHICCQGLLHPVLRSTFWLKNNCGNILLRLQRRIEGNLERMKAEPRAKTITSIKDKKI